MWISLQLPAWNISLFIFSLQIMKIPGKEIPECPFFPEVNSAILPIIQQNTLIRSMIYKWISWHSGNIQNTANLNKLQPVSHTIMILRINKLDSGKPLLFHSRVVIFPDFLILIFFKLILIVNVMMHIFFTNFILDFDRLDFQDLSWLCIHAPLIPNL